MNERGRKRDIELSCYCKVPQLICGQIAPDIYTAGKDIYTGRTLILAGCEIYTEWYMRCKTLPIVFVHRKTALSAGIDLVNLFFISRGAVGNKYQPCLEELSYSVVVHCILRPLPLPHVKYQQRPKLSLIKEIATLIINI